MSLESFDPLYQRFKTALEWINQEYAKRGWIFGKHGYDPRFESDLKDFDQKVVKPMDEAWKKLSNPEKDSIRL